MTGGQAIPSHDEHTFANEQFYFIRPQSYAEQYCSCKALGGLDNIPLTDKKNWGSGRVTHPQSQSQQLTKQVTETQYDPGFPSSC